MTTAWTAKLTYGKREFALDSGRYNLNDFNPPAVATVPLIASGTSANRRGGGTKIGERATNRSMILSVRVVGASDAEVARGGADLGAFLSLAGSDASKPLFLQVRPNSDVAFEPLWGSYGVNKRYEIVHATQPAVWRRYADADMRAKAAIYESSLQLKPYAVGKVQRLASATGTVIEDKAGWKDGYSRGTIIAEGAGNDDNFHTNPVFGNATYNTNWADSANVTDTENTDERFILYGGSSVKLVTSGSDSTYVESLTLAATDHQLSYHIKLPDGGVVSVTQVQVQYDGSGQSTTYTAIGDDGWYRISATVTGTGGAANAGLSTKDTYTIYMDAAQAKASSYLTPFVYGDMLGVAWSGTAHASASDATAGRVRVAVSDSMNVAEGTLRIVLRMNVVSTALAADGLFFEEDTGEMIMGWNNAATDYRMSDGTNTADGASTSFSVGDVLVFHGVYSPGGGLVLYKDGVSYATNATYTPPTLGTYFYIGTTDAVGSHIGATFMGLATFDRAMTAAEVLADYTNQSKLTADNQRVEPIPYVWSRIGDDIAENALDLANSTGAPHTNYVVCEGIPGSVPAITQFNVVTTGGDFDTERVWLSLLDVDEWFDPTDLLYHDETDTGGQVLYSSGAYKNTTVTTSLIQIMDVGVVLPAEKYRRYLAGREFYTFIRMLDNGSDLSAQFQMALSSAGSDMKTPLRALTTDSTANWYNLGPIIAPDNKTIFADDTNVAGSAPWIIVFAIRSTGSATVFLDYVQFLPRPLVYISPTEAGHSGASESFLLEGRTGLLTNAGNNTIDDFATLIGDVIEMVPEKTNILFSVIAAESGTSVIEHTVGYTWIKVTPRYALL